MQVCILKVSSAIVKPASTRLTLVAHKLFFFAPCAFGVTSYETMQNQLSVLN